MPRIVTKISAVLASVVLLGAAGAVPAQAAGEAYFEFTDTDGRSRFVMQLTDPGSIRHARDLLAGATDERPHVHGRIVKRSVAYNARWSYHLQPETINFFDVAIEVCDASMTYVEDHLDEAGGAFLPGGHWCPWSSRLTRELPPM